MPSQASIFNKGTFTGTEFFTQLFYYRLLTTYAGINMYQVFRVPSRAAELAEGWSHENQITRIKQPYEKSVLGSGSLPFFF